MEHGFFHPDRGYWQTLNEPSAEILATYPAGTIEVPIKPGADYKWQDGSWVYVEPEPEPTPAPRSTAMWRARAIAKVTPHGGGTLFDAVVTAIEAMTDPLVQAAASEAWERGTTFDLDGQIVPVLMAALGMTEEDVLPLIEAAEALPA